MTSARGFEIAPRLALEKVADPSVEVRRLTRNTNKPFTVGTGLGPHRPALASPVRDAVRHTAQRDLETMGERRRFRQSLEPRCDPCAVLLGEVARLLETPARRNRQHHLTRG